MPTNETLSIVLQFGFATLLPVFAGAVLTVLKQSTKLKTAGFWPQQILYGVVFGIIAVFGTEFGINTRDATMNVRDAAPIVAGLYFGGPAGVLAGLIGGIERWFSVLWGRGMFTRFACSVATIAVGIYAALLHRFLFDDRKPTWPLALVIGMVAEVLHLLLVFVTNMDQTAKAFHVVQVCTVPMIACNGISVALAGAAITVASGHDLRRKQGPRDISQNIQAGMLGVVIVAFFATVGFSFALQDSMMHADTTDTLTLALDEVKADVSEDISIVDKSVANRHVGTNGLFVVLDPEGELIGTRSDVTITPEDCSRLQANSSRAPEGTVFETPLLGTDYYGMRESVDGLSVIALLTVEEAAFERDLSVLIISFMEVLIFALLFAAIYLLIKEVVVRSIWQVNGTLGKITSGNLHAEVNVRDSTEFSTLSDDINMTVTSLRNAIAAESARIESDLATAKAIQESALPRTFPPFPDIDAFDIYASMNAAREVGGDFYDFFLIDNTTLGFLIADVSGKGIPAALFMMAAKSELANYMKSGMELAEAVHSANWNLCQGNEAGMFVTVWAATLDFETGKLTYVNAGHNPPLLRHDGSWTWLKKKGGLFLGTFDTAKYRSYTIDLTKGDELFLYTDGVNEAFSADGEEYGNKRLDEFLASHANFHPHMLIDTMRAELHRWSKGAEQSDDITMLSLEFGTPPEVSGEMTVETTNEGLLALRRRMHFELHQWQCPTEAQDQIDLAIEEIFMQIRKHSYAGSTKPGKVQVAYIYNSNPSGVVISMTDWGVPYDPLSEAAKKTASDDPLAGKGILLAANNTDDMAYIRDHDMNVIAFSKTW